MVSLKQSIQLTDEKSIPVEGGNIIHAVKKSSLGFIDFGEAYFSWIKPGAVKAWKQHTKMTLNLTVPVGQVLFVFAKNNFSTFEEYMISECKPQRITVPPGVWFGFKGMSNHQSLILSIADIEHDPLEVKRRTGASVDYNWIKT